MSLNKKFNNTNLYSDANIVCDFNHNTFIVKLNKSENLLYFSGIVKLRIVKFIIVINYYSLLN